MRLRTLTLAVAALTCLIAVDQVLRSPPSRPAGTAAPTPVAAPAVHRLALPARTDPAAYVPDADAEALRTAIAAAGPTVYLSGMFGETDSLVRRWSEEDVQQLRVAFVQEPLKGWTPADHAIALAALEEWERLEVPVHFNEMVDTADAQIVVRWVSRFDFDRSGQADLRWDERGRIMHAVIQLALEDQRGRPLPPEGRRAVALHEVGHALGLPHSDRADDLMAPTTRYPILTARDSATFRLLYRFPPMSIKWPVDSSSH